MPILKKLVRGSIILSYGLIALEIIIMISPFAFYFYSFYGPSLKGFYALPATRWLTAFFLPHILLSNNVILNTLDRIASYLFPLGLWIFLIGAIHVYGSKLLRKGPVTKGLYAFVRHPQYLGLIISGLGLLLFWPRFFILVMYVTMVFIYYHLARHEERIMEKRYGEAYVDYKRKTGMFLPGLLENQLSSLTRRLGFRKRPSLILAYGVSLLLALGFAFILREYSKRYIPSFQVGEGGPRVIYSYPREESEMQRVIGVALNDEKTKLLLNGSKGGQKASYLVHIVPSIHGMHRLIATADQTLKKPERFDWDALRFPIGLLVPPIGGSHHQSCQDQEEKFKVIFSVLSSSHGGEADISEALDINTVRTPLFLVEVDSEAGTVLSVKETMPRHYWGDMPMPAF